MGLLKTKLLTKTPADIATTDWPADAIDGVDDAAFAEAIAAGRVNEADQKVTVAA